MDGDWRAKAHREREGKIIIIESRRKFLSVFIGLQNDAEIILI